MARALGQAGPEPWGTLSAGHLLPTEPRLPRTYLPRGGVCPPTERGSWAGAPRGPHTHLRPSRQKLPDKGEDSQNDVYSTVICEN